MRELRIDREFCDLLPKLSAEELDHLESSLEDEGCRDPIITWANHDDTIIDGHNRYRICKRLGVSFRTKAIVLEDRESVKEWMLRNQLARRNVTDEQRKYVVGKLYEARKKRLGSNQYTDPDCLRQSGGASETAQQVATEVNMPARSVERAALFSKGLDAIADEAGDTIKDAILRGEVKVTSSDVERLGAKVSKAEKGKGPKVTEDDVLTVVDRHVKKEKPPVSDKQKPTWDKALSIAARRKSVTKEDMANICGGGGLEYARQRLDTLVNSKGYIVTRSSDGGYRVRKAAHFALEDAKGDGCLDAMRSIRKLALDAKKLLLHTGSDSFQWTDAQSLIGELIRITNDFPCD